jgi:hypothetical protein
VTIRLVSLDCPSCGSALRGEGLDTIFFCEHCGDAAVLEESGLVMIESLALLPKAGRSAKIWRPAWLVEADVAVRERIGHRGGRRGEWEGRRRFVIPAFAVSLVDLTRLARALSEVVEETGEVPREPIHGGTLSLDDALTLIRHIVIGDEVRKSDMLASVTVDVDVVTARLAAIPLEPVARGLRCSITGVSVNVED